MRTSITSGGPVVATLAAIIISGLSPLAAADAALASWRAGGVSVAGAVAHSGTSVASGQAVTSEDTKPARIELSAPASGVLSLAPGTSLSLSVEDHDGAHELVIVLDHGAVQIDLADKARYSDVEIRSGGMAVRIVGTLLVVEHVKGDESYAALVHGSIAVGARAAARSVRQWLALNSRQASSWIGAGFGPILSMSERPQIDLPVGSRQSLLTQLNHGTTAETREFTSGLRGASFAGKAGETADLGERSWHRDDISERLVVLAAAEDLGAGAALAADVARADPIAGGQAVAAVVLANPENAALFVGAVIGSSPEAASEIVGQAVFASPDHAVDIMSAAITAAPGRIGEMVASAVANQPDLATDLTVAALTVAPEHAADIVAAAISANPAAADAIIAIALVLSPDSAVAIKAAAKGALASSARQGAARSSGSAGNSTGRDAVSGPVLDELVRQIHEQQSLRDLAQDTNPNQAPVSPER